LGLVGYANGSTGALARHLWAVYPFCRWLVPQHPDEGWLLDADANIQHNKTDRQLFLITGCHKISHTFLNGLNVVVALTQTWPDQLFSYCQSYGQRSILICHETEGHKVLRGWFRHASRILVPSLTCLNNLRLAGLLRSCSLVNLPGNPEAPCDYQELWRHWVGHQN